ncbi:MAG: 4-hydroxy-tetrahydrodipicolinate reductase [Deltaproteobacteria bacterium]|nr:4-hydroxy-tetrahydrodipicolinate reductase [Deltaproteobacteria bacterium]MBN2673163.1 4-hydroxy-tetrahydrodipicolinate reductase [Deltaproteobacteria bacterium]
MSQIKIALVGAAGRMGQEITRAATARAECEIGAAVEYDGCPLIGKDIGEVSGVGSLNVSVTADLEAAARSCDVILDVSLPTATAGIIDTAKTTTTALVCGITGTLEKSVMNKFDEAAATIPVIHTKNFSVGVAVLSALVKQAAAILGPDYDIEIIEKHHNKKVDAPSGTAQILADAIIDNGAEHSCIYGREGHTGARSAGEIGVHAVRGGGIFGEHTVMFIGQNERLELGHVAHTRSLFAEGAVRTAIFMATATPGRYTMADVLGLHR